MGKIDLLFADLKVLDLPERVMILEYLMENKGLDINLDKAASDLSSIDKTALKMHMRVLNASNMIHNRGFDSSTKFSISEKGEKIITLLQNNPNELLRVYEITK